MPGMENATMNKRVLKQDDGRCLKDENWQTLAHFVHFRVFSDFLLSFSIFVIIFDFI